MIFQNWALPLTAGIEAIAGLIVMFAVLRAGLHSLALLTHRQASMREKDEVRIELSGWLVLGLEFELAADIIRTTLTPSWTALGQLAAIIALRTALNYLLQQDIERAEKRADA